VAGDSATVSLGEQSLAIPASTLAERPALRRFDGRQVVVGIRPEHLSDATLGRSGAPTDGARLRGEVELREALGSELLVHVRTDCRPAVTEDVRSVVGDVDEAGVEILERQAGEGAMVVARFDARSRARVTDAVEMDVDVDRLQFFDPESGRRIAGDDDAATAVGDTGATPAEPATSDAG
jgi:multiple sugar transport system ATP-binding protein